MIRITNITVLLASLAAAPHPGTDYRLIEEGETGRPGDDYFDIKDGQWKPDTNPITDEPFNPALHAPARRKKGPVYNPYDRESIPLPLVVRRIGTGNRSAVLFATESGVSIGSGLNPNYGELLEAFTHDDGTPCGILVSE